MSRDTLYEQKFQKNDGSTIEKYVWTSDMEKGNYPKDEDGNMMIPIFEEIVEGPLIITGKMSPQQVQKERQARSSQHFKKEILPTLGRDEKLHFGKKFNKKSNDR